MSMLFADIGFLFGVGVKDEFNTGGEVNNAIQTIIAVNDSK